MIRVSEDLILVKNHKKIIEEYMEHRSLLRLLKELKLFNKRFVYFTSKMVYNSKILKNNNYKKNKNAFTFYELIEVDLPNLYTRDTDLFDMIPKDINFMLNFLKVFKKLTKKNFIQVWQDSEEHSYKLEHWAMDGQYINFDF